MGLEIQSLAGELFPSNTFIFVIKGYVITQGTSAAIARVDELTSVPSLALAQCHQYLS